MGGMGVLLLAGFTFCEPLLISLSLHYSRLHPFPDVNPDAADSTLSNTPVVFESCTFYHNSAESKVGVTCSDHTRDAWLWVVLLWVP